MVFVTVPLAGSTRATSPAFGRVTQTDPPAVATCASEGPTVTCRSAVPVTGSTCHTSPVCFAAQTACSPTAIDVDPSSPEGTFGAPIGALPVIAPVDVSRDATGSDAPTHSD